MRIKRIAIHKIFSLVALVIPMAGAAQLPALDFDNILSGMNQPAQGNASTVQPAKNGKSANVSSRTAIPDLDAVLAAMGTSAQATEKPRTPDLNLISGFMGDEPQLTASVSREKVLDGVSREMMVGKTLDFMQNSFSTTGGGYLTCFTPGSSSVKSAFISGDATLPIRGIITSKFGYRALFKRMHHGIDISLKVGDTIRSAMEGTVARVDNDPKGYGLFVCVKHNGGLETRYAHLSNTLVYPGKRVYVGEPIALGGNTGNSTGPHLHFETRVNGTPVDPTSMFDFAHPSLNYAAMKAKGNAGEAMQNAMAANAALNSKGGIADKSTYVVKFGDTLQSISLATGIPVLKLCGLNMLKENEPLTPGRMLKLR